MFTPPDSNLCEYSFPQVTTALSSVTSFLVTLKIILNQQESLKPTGTQSRVAPSEAAAGSWRPMPTETRSTLTAVRSGKLPPSRWISREPGEPALCCLQDPELIASPDLTVGFVQRCPLSLGTWTSKSHWVLTTQKYRCVKLSQGFFAISSHTYSLHRQHIMSTTAYKQMCKYNMK